MQLLDHHWLVGWEKSSAILHDKVPSLVEVYKKRVLRPDSDRNGSEEIVEAEKVFVKDMEAFVSKIALIAELYHTDLLLGRHSLCICCTSVAMSTKMQRCLNS